MAHSVAINILDVLRMGDDTRRNLLGGRIDASAPVVADAERADEVAAALACDDLTAAMVCDVVRAMDRKCGDPPARVYVRRGSAWRRVPGATKLTAVVGGEVVLSEQVFPTAGEVVSVSAPPPAAKSVLLGRK